MVEQSIRSPDPNLLLSAEECGFESWAQFHRAAKLKHLLSMKLLPCEKQDYQPKFHVIFRISKQQLKTSKTSNMQQIEIWLIILFLSREISC